MKSTLISTAIVMAMGLSAAHLQAQPATQPAQPAVGNSINSDVNRANQNLDTRRTEARGTIDADDFVETASAKGHAEINAAQTALENGSPQLHAFANKLIADHTTTNNQLKELARQSDLEVADDATLMDRAKGMVLSVRDGDSFDRAFIDNQIAAHEESIELFQRAANSDNPEISAFARSKLPTLEEHLRMANALKQEVGSL